MSFDSRCIAVSQRIVEVPGYEERRDCLDQQWTVWLNSLGFECVPVPNRCTFPARFIAALRPRGIILSGGNNLTLDVYDGSVPNPGPSDAYEARDRTERALVEFAVQGRVPLLACCRGMQFLHAYFGGRLSCLTGAPVTHIASAHPVTLTDPSFARLAGQTSLMVNSFHEYGIESGGLGGPLVPFAVSPSDSLVEGLFHPALPIAGIMWHPERCNPAAAFDRNLAVYLFGSCEDT
jgi:gamma-glutamyl-gamma-aminobutyrate hydrolase PuuD